MNISFHTVIAFICLFIVLPLGKSAVAAKSDGFGTLPAISLEEAIPIAKAYTKEKKVDLSKFYLHSIGRLYSPKDCWKFYWQMIPPIAGGHYIVTVYMDGKAFGTEGR